MSSDDILTKLRPFCSDSSIEVQPRLDVLHILEKVKFSRSKDDLKRQVNPKLQHFLNRLVDFHKIWHEYTRGKVRRDD